jgi:chromatin remodeling complex protein RSC6
MTTIRRKYKIILRDFKKEHKQYVKFLKKEEKRNNKKRSKGMKSGIHQECEISDKLCQFMNMPPGSKAARTTATVVINRYIKKKTLQCSDDKKKFRIDPTLSRLFDIEVGQRLSYFEIPGKMNRHFASKKNKLNNNLNNNSSSTEN